jgi:hypothetical protein
VDAEVKAERGPFQELFTYMDAGLELDHVFVCTTTPEAATRALTDAGFVCGANRVHEGQGTENAVFCFDNAYLELLWMHDETQLRSAAVSGICLWERVHWQSTGACPFGIALRPTAPGAVERFATWRYEAPFLPEGLSIPIVSAKGSAHEPLVFLMDRGGAPARYPAQRAVPLEQKGQRRVLRHAGVAVRDGLVSASVAAAAALGLFSVTAAAHHMRLEFESAGPVEVLDFGPELPLSISWRA